MTPELRLSFRSMTVRSKDRTPNTALVAARVRLNMSQDDLVRALREVGWSSCERRTLQRYESGEVINPQYPARRALTQVLKVAWKDLGFPLREHERDQDDPARRPALTTDDGGTETGLSGTGFDPDTGMVFSEGTDEMRRRTFALGMATAGLSLTGTSPADAMAGAAEAIRHGLLASVPDASAETQVAEWEHIVGEYAVRHLVTPPTILLRSYLNDLQQLNLALSIHDTPSSPDLYRVGAVLTSLTAWTYGNLDAVDQAGRWWRTAHRLAAASRDAQTRVWVSAQEAVMAHYQGSHTFDVIIDAIAQAEPLAETVPYSPATAWLFCGKAQVLGMAGRTQDAEVALRRLREIYSGLSSSVTNDRESFLGWPETRLRYTESLTYSHLGNYAAASTAQDRALSLYPAAVRRDPVKIELQRAICLAKSGASTDAARHATTQLALLDPAQHDLPMADLASRVLRCLPRSRVSDEADQLRLYVAARPLALTAGHDA